MKAAEWNRRHSARTLVMYQPPLYPSLAHITWTDGPAYEDHCGTLVKLEGFRGGIPLRAVRPLGDRPSTGGDMPILEHDHTCPRAWAIRNHQRAADFPCECYQPAPDMYEDIRAFNAEVVGPDVDRSEEGPSFPPADSLELGLKLVLEEVNETIRACGYKVGLGWSFNSSDPVVIQAGDGGPFPDLVEAADGIADSIVVLLGLALRLGMSREVFYRVWSEVQRSNMAKAGGPTRPDGKRMKPDGWTPPDIAGALGLK